MSIYRKIWQDHHNQSIPKGWHIHHIDGNHENNHPDNLMCVSPYVHWCIHLLQGDPVAESGKFISNAGKAGKLGGAKNLGKKRNDKQREKMRERMRTNNPFKDKSHTEETKKLIGEKNRGKNETFWITNGTDNQKMKKNEAIPDGWYKGRVTPWNKGVPKSKEYKKKVSESHNKVWTCPHCNKSGGRMMFRWHFDYCREREGGPLKEINTSNMGKYERTKENREKLSKIVTEYYKRRKSNE